MTISVPSRHATAWIEIFTEKYGESRDKTSSNNGNQFKTNEDVNIHVWFKPNLNMSTILIDGKKGYVNYVEEVIPELFKEVLSRLKRSLTSEPSTFKKATALKKYKCNECDFSSDKLRLKVHKDTNHSGSKRSRLPVQRKTRVAK